MKLSSIVLTTLAVVATGVTVYLTLNTPNKSYIREFAEFKTEYGKLYSSLSEAEYRYTVFAD